MQVHAGTLEVVRRIAEVTQIPSEPIDTVDDDVVPCDGRVDNLLPSWTQGKILAPATDPRIDYGYLWNLWYNISCVLCAANYLVLLA